MLAIGSSTLFPSSHDQRRRKLRKSRGANNYLLIIGVYCTRLFGHDTNSCCTYYTAVIACIIINKHKFNNIEGVVNKMAAQVHQ